MVFLSLENIELMVKPKQKMSTVKLMFFR